MPTTTWRCVRAYNDWLSEYVAHAPERFGGLAMLPNRGVEDAVAEIDRVVDRPGIRGVRDGLLPERHARGATPMTTRCSGASELRRGCRCSIHVSLNQTMPAAHESALPGYGRFFDVAESHASS